MKKSSTTLLRFALLLFFLCSLPFLTYAQRIYANNQRSGASGLLCLNCKVDNDDYAADGITQTHSTINVSLGIASQTYQELIFPGKVAAGTRVSVKLGTGDNLLDLTALGGISIQAYNGNSDIGSPLTASTLLSAVSNNNQVLINFTPTQQYDRVRVTLHGGLLGVLSNIYLYDAFYSGPNPVACNNAIDEIHGVSAGLLNLGLNVGGVANPQQGIDGNITTASTLNAGIGLVGAAAQQTAIFQSLSILGDSVRVTMAVPQALISVSVLSNVSVSTFNGNTNNNDSHSVSSGLLNLRLLDLSNNIQKFTITYVPTKIFDRVQVTLGGGIANVLSSLNLYEVEQVMPRPVINYNNVATNNVQLCAGSTATLTATAVAGSTFKWYEAATGGTAIHTGASFTTPALAITKTYYVSASRAGCTNESDRAAVTITVNQIPVAPVIANAAAIICPGQPATFNATAVAGITINWYTTPTGGTPVSTGNNFTTGALTQDASYYAEAVAGGTCVSATRTKVTATVSPLPATPTLSPASAAICDGDVAVLSINAPVSGVTYNWYATSTGGTLIYTGINFTTPVLHANTIYYAEAVSATGCSSSTRVQGTVTVQPKPADPTLAANSLTINAGQTANITVTNSQTGIVYNWYTSATAATAIHTGSSYVTPQLYATTTYYVSAVNANGCQSVNRTAITINVTINNNSPCTFANQQTNNVGGVCIACSVENDALATDADTTTASTIHVPVGLLNGYAEQQLQFQQAGFAGDLVKLVLQSPVNLADVGLLSKISVTLYNGANALTTYTLDNALISLKLLSAGNRYAVYIPATGGYDRVTIRLSGVATLLSSLNIYYAAQQFPKVVFANANPEICKGSPATLTVTAPTNGTFKWYDAPTAGTLLKTGTTYTSGALNANTTYYVEYTRGTCVSPVRYPIQVLVNDPPAKPTVAPTNTTIFAGQTATFTATSVNNTVIKWYDAPTNGTLVHTGTSFTTPALNANKSYYAEAVTGTCVSPDRTQVNVTVVPVVIPDVTVNPPTQAVNPGASASLTASSTTPGVTFNWYTTPAGGTIVHTGATYNTPSIFTNQVFYAEAVVTATGAKSAARASGEVTVNSTGTNPVPCDAAIAQTPDVNALLCLGCSVSNAPGSIDGDRNTFARLNVPIGLLAYAQQTLRFAGTGRAGDSVVVELGIPGSLATVGILSQVNLATYNGSTFNNDRFTVNGSLLSITLLNGTSRFRVAFKAASDFDRVEIRLNAALAGVFNALNIYDAYQSVAAPIISAPAVTACQGTQATLSATVPAHVTVKWYSSATGGTLLFTGPVFNTPVLTANTTYYAEASRTGSGCAQPVRTPVTVTVTPTPAAPVVAVPNTTICSGQPASFTAQAVNGVTFKWYSTAAGGTAIGTGATFTSDPLNATTSFYVEAVGSGQCGSSTRTQVTATVTTTPVVPTIQQTPVETCSGSSATLTATSAQPGITFNWYTAATGGTPIFTGAQFVTPALTANKSYYVEAASGTCTSPTRAKADVVVNPAPVNPVVTVTPTGGQITSGQTAQLSATSTTAGVTFKWYTSETGGTAIHTGNTFTTPVLTSNATYYVEAVLPTGCTSPQRTKVTITVNPVFSTSCDFASSQTKDINNGLLCAFCGVTNENNPVDADTTNFSQLNLPLSALNSYVAQKLIFSEPGILGDTVTVKISLPVSLLSVGILDQLQIASYSGNTYNGDRINLSSTLIRIQLLSGGKTAFIKFAPGAAFDGVEIRLRALGLSLFSSANIYYASKQVEAPEVATGNFNICSGSPVTLAVKNPRNGLTYKWYDAPVGGALLHTGATYLVTSVNATTTYYVESSRTTNSCVNPNRAAATVNVTQSPDVPTLTQNNSQICAGDNVILSVSNANGATVKWYDAPTGGNLLFTGANYQVAPIANADYYAELTNGNCTSPSRAHAIVVVNPRPSKPGVQSNNVQVCIGSPATLDILNPEAGVDYKWYTTAVGGTAVYTGNTYVTGAINQNTIYYIEAVNATSPCSNNGGRTQVNVNVTTAVNAPTLSATQTQSCAGGNVTLSVVNPIAGLLYNWYTQGGTLVYTGITFNIININADASYFVEAVNSIGCVSDTRTRTDITVNPVPPPPVVEAGANGLTVCEGGSATLNISNPEANIIYRWFNAASNGTLLYTGTQFVTPAILATTTYYVEASGAGNCSSSALTPVTVTINPIPVDPTVNNNNPVVCYGDGATLTVSSPQAGIVYNWYDSPALTTLLFTGTTYITGPITATTNFYVASANSTGCTSGNLVQVQVTTQTPPPAPIVANGSTVQTCTGSTVTLSIANPQAGYTYKWYTVSAGGTAVATGNDFTTTALTASTTYYAEAVNSIGCGSAIRTPVDITIVPPPAAPQLNAGNVDVCPGTVATLSVSNNDVAITIKWYSDAAATNLLATGNSYTTGALSANTTYYVQATNALGCTSAVATATVTIIPQLTAPVVTVGTTTNTSVTFQWAAIAGATGYQVSTDNGATFSAASTEISYTVTGLQPNQSVAVVVRALSACQPGANSQAVTGKSNNPFGNGIYVPNAFTPNADGNNDILYVYGTNIKSVSLWIYNQWGESIFRSSTQASGWDGTFKGTAQPVGVYVYYVEATMNDGQIIKKKGTVTLLR